LSNLYPNDLLRKETNGFYTNVTEESMTGNPGMGWGMFFFDYDNDADKDIFINNMSSMGNYANVLYRNDGNGQFTSIISPGEALQSYSTGYGAAYADFNRDGYLDIIIANTSGMDVNQLFINENSGNNWVTFELEGTVSNRNAINSKLHVYTDSLTQIDELLGGSGYCSQNMMGEHFGLGQRTLVDSIKIEWPSGITETYDSLEVNTTYLITEGLGIQDYAELFVEEEIVEVPDTIEFELFDLEITNPSAAFEHLEQVVLTPLDEEEEEEEEEEEFYPSSSPYF